MLKRSKSVLLVEDNAGLRRTLADILRAAGMKVDTAADAPAAFRKLDRGRYDVAVVDMVLPGPSGVEVIRKIKSTAPATRIIACTAFYDGHLLADALELGVELTVYKPADPGLLIGLIEQSAGPAPGGTARTSDPELF
jgi:DNA-binding response OmpR family regulator